MYEASTSTNAQDYTHILVQGILAGVPFFDEVFSQLGCTYVFDILHLHLYLHSLTSPEPNGMSKKVNL